MPPSTDDKILDLIVAALKRGESRSQISTAYQVSPRNITRISTNLKKHGSPRAPPSGLKHGRPIKMTKEQADAMLAWMAGRDYTFYVRDLANFLAENYAFEGCYGTIRRVIIRAGFERRLPRRKSQITSWTPPEGKPDLSFVYDANPPKSSSRSRARKAASAAATAAAAVAVENDNAESTAPASTDDGTEDRVTEDSDIDPALQAAEAATALLSDAQAGHVAASTGSEAAQGSAPVPATQIPLDPQLTQAPPPESTAPASARQPPVTKRDEHVQQARAASGVEVDEMAMLRQQLEQQREEIERLKSQIAGSPQVDPQLAQMALPRPYEGGRRSAGPPPDPSAWQKREVDEHQDEPNGADETRARQAHVFDDEDMQDAPHDDDDDDQDGDEDDADEAI